MRTAWSKRPLAVGCAVMLGTTVLTREAEARGPNFFAGAAAAAAAAVIGGAIIGGALINKKARAQPSAPRAARSSAGRNSASGETAKTGVLDEKVLASLGGSGSRLSVPVLATFKSSGLLGTVGTISEKDKILTLSPNEGDRDYAAKVKDIIDRFKREIPKGDQTAGDVTEHGIMTALDEAFQKSRLDRFESFIGENWTGERLRVMILNRVITEVPSLFAGNNRGLAPMSALKSLIQRSADIVYRRLFESSELLAANKSMATFLRRVYEAHGGPGGEKAAEVDEDREKQVSREIRLSSELKEAADAMLSGASTQAIVRFEGLFRRDPNSFALRYRAQRVMFDCLSEHVEEVTTSPSGSGVAEVAEIKRRVEQTALNACAEWLLQTFGAARDKVNEQNPLPVRVLWSEKGPKDNPNLYGRAAGTL